MTSLQTSVRQVPVNAPNFVVIAPVTNATTYLRFTPDTNNVTGTFITEPNAADVPLTVGTMFRDMGSVVVSAGRTFRRVQYVLPGSGHTQVAGGPTNGVLQIDDATTFQYNTFYIELGANGGTSSVKVARV